MWLSVLLQVLPSLISLVEKLLGPKNGEIKKELVMGATQIAMTAVGAISTGGQAQTWERIKPDVSTIVDSGVSILFPHEPGSVPSQAGQM
jgi:hypothetical protein